MANAFRFFTHPSIPIRVSSSGFYVSNQFSKRVLCSSVSSIDGVDKHASPSPAEYQRPRLVTSGCKLIGCGSAVPSLLISNDDLAKIVDTNDEWIATLQYLCSQGITQDVQSSTRAIRVAEDRLRRLTNTNPGSAITLKLSFRTIDFHTVNSM